MYAAGADTRNRRRRATNIVIPTPSRVIGYELLQWFVDEIVKIKNRPGSRLCLDEARRLRDILLENGSPLPTLPKITKQ